MKIRATTKLLRLSGIKPIKDEAPLDEKLPGEWYASIVSMSKPGKLAIHFLHYPTLFSIIIPGKSLKKVIPILLIRTASLLDRHGYSILKSKIVLTNKTEVYQANNRSMLAHLTQLKHNIEYHLALQPNIENIDFDYIEDIQFDYLFGFKTLKGKYIQPKDTLDKLGIDCK